MFHCVFQLTFWFMGYLLIVYIPNQLIVLDIDARVIRRLTYALCTNCCMIQFIPYRFLISNSLYHISTRIKFVLLCFFLLLGCSFCSFPSYVIVCQAMFVMCIPSCPLEYNLYPSQLSITFKIMYSKTPTLVKGSFNFSKCIECEHNN